MAAETLQRTKVWNGGLRLIHWTMAVAVALLIGSGWLLERDLSTSLRADAYRIHEIAGYLLTLSLLFRFYALFFGSGSDLWRDFLPRGAQWNAVRETFVFYLSGTRTPLPSWYAHNPLWGPIHLFMFLVLAGQAFTGFLLRNDPFGHLRIGGYSVAGSHDVGYAVIALLALLHVIATFLHDWKGTSSEISAMISGYKIFLLRKIGTDVPANVKGIPVRFEARKKRE